jgi:chemotaxis protein CheX
MDVAYINPFIRGIREVFTSMVKIPFTIGRPSLKDHEQRLDRLFKVSAVIQLSGQTAGQVVLNLSEPVALALSSAIAGTQMTELNADCKDALAEITNMIAGSAKKELPGGQVTLEIPKVLDTGKVAYPPNQPVITMPLDTPSGRFLLEISLSRRPA